jgi:hypothetical protein
LIVILEVPADEASARKAELSREEFMRQSDEWRTMRPLAEVVYLDGTRPVTDLVGQVLKELER